MSDDMTPSDVEPNGGPCISEEEIQRRNAELMAVPPVERAVIILDHYRKPGSGEHTLAKLRKQLAALEAIERELERKKQVINEIADIREKIKLKGEIPCA
jgi:DNA repair exonuclease SbcCD ATPase subunit